MIADAPAVHGAAGTTARLVLAVAVSMLLHAFLLAGSGGLADGLRWEAFPPSAPGNPALHATLRPPPAETAPRSGKRAPTTRTESAVPPQAAGPSAGAGLLPAPKYHRAEELDRRPLIRVQVEPQFPALALAPTGRVVLRLYVNESGEVDAVGIESAEATGAFADAARAAFAAARYYPGIKDGVPVKSLVRIEVLFGLPPPPAPAAPGR